MTDTCEIKHCRQPGELIYQGHVVCDYHWRHHCAGTFNLKEELGLTR